MADVDVNPEPERAAIVSWSIVWGDSESNEPAGEEVVNTRDRPLRPFPEFLKKAPAPEPGIEMPPWNSSGSTLDT